MYSETPGLLMEVCTSVTLHQGWIEDGCRCAEVAAMEGGKGVVEGLDVVLRGDQMSVAGVGPQGAG